MQTESEIRFDQSLANLYESMLPTIVPGGAGYHAITHVGWNDNDE